MNFKFVISNGNRSYQIERDQRECPVIGKRIGESFGGDFLGLEGYELVITGGSDKDGFPMRSDVEGIVKKRIILERGMGFRAEKGLRKRKMVRGNTIGLDVVQINCNVTKKGGKPLEELLGKEGAKEVKSEKEEVKPEKAKEEKKEEKPKEESKPEEKEAKEAKPEKQKPEEKKEEIKPGEQEKKEAKAEKKEIKEEAKPEEKPEKEKKEIKEQGASSS